LRTAFVPRYRWMRKAVAWLFGERVAVCGDDLETISCVYFEAGKLLWRVWQSKNLSWLLQSMVAYLVDPLVWHLGSLRDLTAGRHHRHCRTKDAVASQIANNAETQWNTTSSNRYTMVDLMPAGSMFDTTRQNSGPIIDKIISRSACTSVSRFPDSRNCGSAMTRWDRMLSLWARFIRGGQACPSGGITSSASIN
jgi:hypothetical protein